MINQLPVVDRIQGCIVRDYGSPEQSQIRLQYLDADGRWNELWMPFLDGMYLLNLLKVCQREMHFEMPDDPSASS
jgi:hypothetical protein